MQKIKVLDDDSGQTAAFVASLNLKIGAKVLLHRNMNVTEGLCNGLIGQLVKV